MQRRELLKKIILAMPFAGLGAAAVSSTVNASELTLREELANNSDPNLGSSLVGYRHPHSQAGTTVSAKLSDMVSARDFGALGDHYTDDTIALKAALDYVGSVKNSTQGGVLYLPKGVYRITAPLAVPTKVHLVGEGISTVIRADASFAGNCMASLGPVDSNVFDCRIRNLRFHQNGASIGKAIIYSNSMNQQCGVFDVLIDGLAGTEGIVFEGGPNTSGPSLVEVDKVNIQAASSVVNGIRTNVGGMILKVSHLTVEAANENTISRGVYLEKDILCGDGLHFEGCSYGIVFGTESLGGKGSVITANGTTGTLVALVSTFYRGGVVLECLEHRSLVKTGLIALQNNQNGDTFTDTFVTSYSYQPPA